MGKNNAYVPTTVPTTVSASDLYSNPAIQQHWPL